ncbi:hypothetical protein LCGC14_2958360, partial [marine sediment metagenome]
AEFHHCYGALLVEVDSDGNWFARQINADSEGTIHDVDVRVKKGVLTTGNRVKGINWGDIHRKKIAPIVDRLAWGKGGMFQVLDPEYQFMNDLLNFGRRNHHDLKNPHKMFELYVRGQEDVAEEVRETAEWLSDKSGLSSNCQTVVVHSNHDAALELWLRDTNPDKDPLNAEFYYAAKVALYDAIREGDDNFDMLEWACQQAMGLKGYLDFGLTQVKFLREDESFIICPDANGGIECGMHGHLGPHGSRGSAGAFAKMGRKSNIGHTHRAGIVDGVYTAGTSSLINLPYNAGPSARSHSHILTYKNGKRVIITMWNRKWRA